MTHSQITSFIWSVADLIRDTFKRGKYQDIILPLTVLRRIDQVLEPTKGKVLNTYSKYKGKLDNPEDLLRKASGFAFYNTSLYTFERLVDDPQNIAHNLRTYIQSFSPNMREVIEKFDFDNTITKLDDAGLLFQVMEKFAQVDLHPDRVSNPMMGTIFEELIRKFNEALNENPGEHFTPRDVVHLMVRLLVEGEDEKLGRERPIFTVHDPCCGTGGMLTITKDVIQGSPKLEGLNPNPDVHLFGQEVNPETFAICKADLFIKGDRSDADNILYGSTLAVDGPATITLQRRRRRRYQVAVRIAE
jgi:type I restriction enzyme M protein